MDEISTTTNYRINFPNLIKINRYKKNVNILFRENAHLNRNFILNIKLSSQMLLILEIYSEENPTNLYYKSKFNLNELNNLHSYFKSFININDIYEAINEVVNKGKYDIKFEGNSNLKVDLILYINNEQIKFHLNKAKNTFDQNDLELSEFINQFYNEFLSLKTQLNNQMNKENDEIKKLGQENNEIKTKLEKIEKDNNALNSQIKQLTRNITEEGPRDNIKKKSSNIEIINEPSVNQLNQNNLINNAQQNHYQVNPYMNNNQSDYFPLFLNNNGYNNHPSFFINNISNIGDIKT